MFTDNAFIAPVTIVATGGPLVADNTLQPLGSLTLTELVPDAIDAGPHTIKLSNITLAGTPTVTVTGNANPAPATGTATVLGDTITLTLSAGMNPATSGVVTISGLLGFTNVPGPVVATWATSPGLPLNYLLPDDQTFGNFATLASDVNVPLLQSAFTTATGVPTRIGGNDRYETSAKIAANVDSCTEWAVVVSGTSFADALSANYLAGALESNVPSYVPVLLVGTDSVPASVAAYMSSAGVKNVYIVGGTSAVSAAVESALKATSATKCTGVNSINSTNPVPNQKLLVVRVSGANRYATNRAVVNLGSDIFEENSNMIQLEFLQPSKHTAIVATGTGFADALAAGPAVYDGFPLVLTDGTSLSPEAALTLTDNDITQVIIIGGTSAVSDAVKAQIVALGIQAERISGANRYATATAFADFLAKAGPSAAVAGAFDGGFNWGPATGVLLASGTNFADALSAGPLSYNWSAPIILTEPTVLSADSQTWLVAHRVPLTYVTALGLGSAVSTSVLNAASAAIS
jgi:putative cell wall-binding protein